MAPEQGGLARRAKGSEIGPAAAHSKAPDLSFRLKSLDSLQNSFLSKNFQKAR